VTSQRTPEVYLFGNLGADPETKTLRARSAGEADGPAGDDALSSAREIRTASIAVNAEAADGHRVTHWHRLVDFAGHLATYRKGDRLKVRGSFRTRTYTQNGQRKSIREFLVTEVSVLKLRFRPA
jgi:single-stranded DNA-binding protein